MFEVIFVVFRMMKNIIFNKIESFVGKNTSDHVCQIFASKGNGETMYHWFFLLEIIVVEIMNNLNVCSAHSYLYPWSRFKSLILTWPPSFALHTNRYNLISTCAGECDWLLHWQHKLCATFSASVNINYRLPIKVYYRMHTLRHIRIEINHGSG
jgi:hypothetical protein